MSNSICLSDLAKLVDESFFAGYRSCTLRRHLTCASIFSVPELIMMMSRFSLASAKTSHELGVHEFNFLCNIEQCHEESI